MIISASRRTDIPRFHTPWFLERVRAGYCVYPNPLDPRRQVRVSLRPEDVDVIVFWSKDPAPLLSVLPELAARGYRFYLHFTVNGYPPFLEPGVRPLPEILDAFARLADAVSPDRVIWRYDPIVLSDATPPDYHRRQFEGLAARLAGHTRRVVVSVFDDYRRAGAMLRRAARRASVRLDLSGPGTPVMDSLLADLAAISRSNGLDISSCAELQDLTPLGIRPGKCIDDGFIRGTFGIRVSGRKDPGQRPACRCVESRDIGTYGTCRHGCTYCYATGFARGKARGHEEAGEGAGRVRCADPADGVAGSAG
ncbi:MAG: DUF1848 domain-containing protein [Bacillota bacterium]|nr:DUF1848 domain-containing protein [Bacillota bacterium]